MSIYLDYAATTPVDPQVNEAIYNWQKEYFGNPSSPHRHGQKSKIKLEQVRDAIASRLMCNSKEITFTSGGTESNNLALIGSALSLKDKGKHIILSGVEHPSVISAGDYLAKQGFEISYLNPNQDGLLSVTDLEKSILTETILISVMYVNNETGIISPIEEIGTLCKKRDIIFHCDAVQAFGKITLDVNKLQTDLLSFSGHKIYGPKGIGGLYIKDGLQLVPLVHGGGQEANKRPGTENITGIIGLGEAVELMKDHKSEFEKVNRLQKTFELGLLENIKDISIIGSKTKRSPYISNISFLGVDNQSLLLALDLQGLSVSVGSACSSGSIKQSGVLQAMGISEPVINSSVRFSYGRFTSTDDIEKAIQIIGKAVSNLRK